MTKEELIKNIETFADQLGHDQFDREVADYKLTKLYDDVQDTDTDNKEAINEMDEIVYQYAHEGLANDEAAENLDFVIDALEA